jgi:hypothetical protein
MSACAAWCEARMTIRPPLGRALAPISAMAIRAGTVVAIHVTTTAAVGQVRGIVVKSFGVRVRLR